MQEKYKLKRKIKYLENKIKKIGPVMRGSIVELKVNCGNKQCRCYKNKKHKHPAIYFSVNMNNKTKLIYLGKKKLEMAKEYNNNYIQLKNIINEMTSVALELIKLSV
jgi:hypothetical protein